MSPHDAYNEDELETDTDPDMDLDMDMEDSGDDDADDDVAPSSGARNGTPGAIDDLAAFVEFMIGNLVDDADAVQVVPEQFGTNVHIKVIVPEADMGRVIGRQGRIARSMRTLLTIAASRKGLRASLDINS